MKKLESMNAEELKNLLQKMGVALTLTAEAYDCEKPLFVLLLFNDPARTQYVSNCDRDGMIAALREAADRFERREDDVRGSPEGDDR